jgi:hypothetical protein
MPESPGARSSAIRASLAWFLPAFVVGAVALVVNLAGSPQRLTGEGTITAQAWTLDKLGQFAGDGFGSTQPPLGWLQLAGYTNLTGAFERYDTAVLAGREFMVVVTLVSAALLWVLARRLLLGRPAAAFAVLLFLVSPLALHFHRAVSLENIATMWLLAALVLALSRRAQVAAFTGAAACFGIAVLSAQVIVLALPLVAWLMWRSAQPSTRRRSLATAAGLLVLIGGGYALLLLTTGGLASSDDRMGGGLLGAAGGSAAPLGLWWQVDPVGIIAALGAAAGALFMKRLRPFGIAVLLLTAAALVPAWSPPETFVVLLIPFGALLIPGVVLSAATSLLPRSSDTFPRQAIAVLLVGATVAAGILAGPLWTTQLRGSFLTDLDQSRRDAQSWIDTNVAKNARLIVDDSMRVDLARAGFARDNLIDYRELADDGGTDADFVISTDTLRAAPGDSAGVDQALDDSLVVASFGQDEQLVDIRAIPPQGAVQATADALAVAADRASAGSQLASNPGLTLENDTNDLLATGHVDGRIILSVAQLLGDESVTVEEFPLVSGERDPVRRQVLLRSVDDDALAEWFRALGAPVDPSAVAVTDAGVLVTFPLGEPEGLLPHVTP